MGYTDSCSQTSYGIYCQAIYNPHSTKLIRLLWAAHESLKMQCAATPNSSKIAYADSVLSQNFNNTTQLFTPLAHSTLTGFSAWETSSIDWCPSDLRRREPLGDLEAYWLILPNKTTKQSLPLCVFRKGWGNRITKRQDQESQVTRLSYMKGKEHILHL